MESASEEGLPEERTRRAAEAEAPVPASGRSLLPPVLI